MKYSEDNQRYPSNPIGYAEKLVLGSLCAYLFLPISVQYIRFVGFLVLTALWLLIVYSRRTAHGLHISGYVSTLVLWLLFLPCSALINNNSQYNADILRICYDTFAFFLPGLILLHYIKDNNTTALKFIRKISNIYLFVGAVNTLIILSIYPFASRVLAFSSEDASLYSRMGAGGFGYIYAVALFLPCLISMLKNRRYDRFRRIRTLTFLILLILLILKASYTFALIIAAIGIVMALYAKKQWHYVVMLLICVLGIAFIDNNTIGRIIVFFAELFESGSILNLKLLDMSKYYLTNMYGASMEGRILVYTETMDAIKASPFFGALTSGIYGSQHTSWLDLYASYGLFSAIPIALQIMMQKALYKNIYFDRKYVYLGAVAMFWMLGLVNPIHLQIHVGYGMYLLLPVTLLDTESSLFIKTVSYNRRG